MPQITRTWLAFCALGVGLVHIAAAGGTPVALAVPLVALGLVEFGWGIVTLARDTIVAPRIALGVALGPLIVVSLAVVAGTLVSGEGFAMIPLEALAASAVLELVAAALLRRGVLRIRGADAAPAVSPAPPAAWRYLLGLGVGALLVGGLVTPALAATEAGDYAQPHGGHQGVGEPGNVEPGDPVGSIPPAQHSGH